MVVLSAWKKGLLLTLFTIAMPVYSAQWQVTPSVSVAEIYTDNVGLTAIAEEDEYVTEIKPSVSMTGKGRGLTLDAKYAMENLFFADDSSRSGTNHQLQAGASAEFIDELFFVDADARAGQEVVSISNGVPIDNINAGNRTDFYTFSLSPYVHHDFAGMMEATARYTNNLVRYSNEGASDSDIQRIDVNLQSGRKPVKTSWNLDYLSEKLDRNGSSDDDKIAAAFDFSYRLSSALSLLLQAGYESYDFGQSLTRSFEDGSYSGVGVAWRPGPKMLIEAVQGSRYSSATVNYTPTRRSSMKVNWRDREVGVNPGSVWSGTLNFRSRRTSWQASYLEDTTTTQRLQLESPVFSAVDPLTGEPVLVPGQDQRTLELLPGDIYSLTNEVFVRKRASASMGFQSGKSGIRITAVKERREFLVSGTNEENKSLRLAWDWKMTGRTRLQFATSMQRSEFLDSSRQDDLKIWDVLLIRQLSPDASALLGFRNSENDSTVAASDYAENRISLRVNMAF